MRLPRRTLLAGSLAAAARGARAASGGVPVLPARVVRNGWGVCANVGQDASVAFYAEMLGRLRTRDLRTVLFAFGLSAAPRLAALGRAMRAAGLSEPSPRVTALVTAYMHDPKTTWPAQQRELLAFAATGMLRAIEGPNEVNGRFAGVGSHGPDDLRDQATPADFAANQFAWAKALYEFRRESSGALGAVATVAPSLVVSPPPVIKGQPDLSTFVDAGNVHFYAGKGFQPNLSLGANPHVGSFRNVFGWTREAQMRGGPVWLTECGASTSGSYARSGVSQAKYLANQLFDYFAAGGARMFVYQAIDGSGKPGETEGNYGLFRRDRSPKPAVAVLAGLQELLSLRSYDDPANAEDRHPVSPALDPARLTVSGLGGPAPTDPSALLLPKADGSTLLALWNEPPIDDGRGSDVEPAARTVTVELGARHRWVVHDLMEAGLESELPERRARPQVGRGFDVPLRGYPVVIEILRGGA